MRRNMLIMLVCALFLSAFVSVSQADYYALHQLSIEPTSGTFDSKTNTFTVGADFGKTFSFNLRYEFLDLSNEQDLADVNNAFPLDINYDEDILTVASTPIYSKNLVSEPYSSEKGIIVPWNNAFGSWYEGDGIGNLVALTFTLNDDDSLKNPFSTEITFSLFNYSLEKEFGLDAQPITVKIVPDDSDTPVVPEPSTILILGIALTTLPFVRKRFRSGSN